MARRDDRPGPFAYEGHPGGSGGVEIPQSLGEGHEIHRLGKMRTTGLRPPCWCTGVTAGNKITAAAGGYRAGVGFDAVTAWGGPKGKMLVEFSS